MSGPSTTSTVGTAGGTAGAAGTTGTAGAAGTAVGGAADAAGTTGTAGAAGTAVGGAADLVTVRHNKIDLALHWLREKGEAGPLLLLHGLGERTPTTVPAIVSAWPGPICGLDFTGHGASTVPRGGGYTAELLMADVDAALSMLGPVTVLGRGLGGYIALLIAGARPTEVRGAILCDGPGLAGGGSAPGSPSVIPPMPTITAVPDPFAMYELSRDVRPPDYAVRFVSQAVQLSGLDSPIAVSAVARPPWLATVAAEPGVVTCTAPEALALFAR